MRRVQSLVLVLLSTAGVFAGNATLRAQTPAVTVQFASSTYTVNESDETAVLTVTLSQATSAVVTVNYATSDGTAVEGTDYTAASGTITFQQNVTSQTINIGIIDNGNYSDQSVYFTAALSEPTNAALGMPASTTVNVLDDDPAPTADIEINGVPAAQKQMPGGYVQVNANNDNGSFLLYADLRGVVPKPGYGIPQTRDLAVSPMMIAGKLAADPDLLQITLATKNLKAGGPENIVLSVQIAGRAKIQLWDSASKNNKIATPTNWTVATMPANVYVEGLLEGAALREVTLTLQILKKGTPVAPADECVLTVTPVLQNLLVTVTIIPAGPNKGKPVFPDKLLDPTWGWLISSGGQAGVLPPGVQPITMNAAAQWNGVRGSLRFIQNASDVNNLAGGTGADLGPRTWDFAVPKQIMLDCLPTASPFYTAGETGPNVAGGVATNSITDAPVLPLTAGPIDPATGKNIFLNSVLPGAGQMTNINVTFSYVTYATVAFQDRSLYFLGQQSWNMQSAGQITPAGGGFNYKPAAANAINGSAAFGAAVLNNGNPSSIGPNNIIDNGQPAWR
jgi:hypothetical protein